MGRSSSGHGGGSTGTAAQAVPRLGHPSDCLTPAARGSHWSRVLLPLLPPKTPLYVYGSLAVSSPHIMEPDCSADPGIWSDLHLQRSNQSEYSHGRYAWIRGTFSRPHPSRFLHLEHTPSGGTSAPRATCIPIASAPMGRASLLRAAVNQQAQMLWTPGSQATTSQAQVPRAPTPSAPKSQVPLPQAPQTVPPLHKPLPSSGSWLATPYQQAVQPPLKPKGRGVTFDTSADKVVAVGSQDTNGWRRQRTHDRDNKTWPTNPGRGAPERSSVRMISKQMPRQVSECPSGAAHNAPRDSTPGSTSHQCSSSTRVPKDPLRHVS